MLSLLFIFAVGCQANGSIEVLEFADDSENETESLSSAFLNIANVPPIFTMCSALMVNEWRHCAFGGCDSRVFNLTWANDGASFLMELLASRTHTSLRFRMGNSIWYKSEVWVFHRAWIRICVSVDRILNIIQFVADGRMLIQERIKGVSKFNGTSGLIVSLGRHQDDWGNKIKYNATISEMNHFSTALSVKRMEEMTLLGNKFCRVQGDLLRKDVMCTK